MDLEGIGIVTAPDQYTGAYENSDYKFPLAQYIECQKHLAAADVVMKELSCQRCLRFYPSVKGAFPGRMLELKSWFRRRRLQVMLNPDYFLNNEIFYVMLVMELDEFFFWSRPISSVQAARFTPEEMNDYSVLRQKMEEIISNWPDG